MRFANTWDIAEFRRRFSGVPILEDAAETLANLEEWANENSDGWAYWPKPVRAAARLIEFLERYSRAYPVSLADNVDEIIAREYRAALRPVKAFRTRHGADFEIVEGRVTV